MGWTIDNGDPAAYEHEGTAVRVLEGGHLAALHKQDQAASLPVIGWKAACARGWVSPSLTRAEGPAAGDDLDDDSPGGQLVIADWESHVRGPLVINAVVIGERARAAAARTLDSAVGEARRHGYSWAQIGHAVGISRQSAHERWSGE